MNIIGATTGPEAHCVRREGGSPNAKQETWFTGREGTKGIASKKGSPKGKEKVSSTPRQKKAQPSEKKERRKKPRMHFDAEKGGGPAWPSKERKRGLLRRGKRKEKRSPRLFSSYRKGGEGGRSSITYDSSFNNGGEGVSQSSLEEKIEKRDLRAIRSRSSGDKRRKEGEKKKSFDRGGRGYLEEERRLQEKKVAPPTSEKGKEEGKSLDHGAIERKKKKEERIRKTRCLEKGGVKGYETAPRRKREKGRCVHFLE